MVTSCSFIPQMKDFWKEGVVNAKTRCWAQGMDGWRPLVTVSQLKWCLLATGQAVMNETDLAVLVLNMLIKMCGYYPSRWVCVWGLIMSGVTGALLHMVTCHFDTHCDRRTLTHLSCFRDVDDAVIRPMPRIKRLLSEAICLPHIVQVSDHTTDHTN